MLRSFQCKRPDMARLHLVCSETKIAIRINSTGSIRCSFQYCDRHKRGRGRFRIMNFTGPCRMIFVEKTMTLREFVHNRVYRSSLTACVICFARLVIQQIATMWQSTRCSKSDFLSGIVFARKFRSKQPNSKNAVLITAKSQLINSTD